MNTFSLENGTEMTLVVRLGGQEEVHEIQPSSFATRQVHGTNPSLTWSTTASLVPVRVFSKDKPDAPPKHFTMSPGTVTLLCPTPFGDTCAPLRLIFVVRNAL